MRASRIHLALLTGWVVLTYPTVTAWRDSVLVVLLYSIYANVCTHWSAYEGAKAKELTAAGYADQGPDQ